MRIIAKRTLRRFWERPGREDAAASLQAWHSVASAANWDSPHAVKRTYGNASIIGDRIVFNIAGNKYRLVVRADYRSQLLFVRSVGSHEEYDLIDVREL